MGAWDLALAGLSQRARRIRVARHTAPVFSSAARAAFEESAQAVAAAGMPQFS